MSDKLHNIFHSGECLPPEMLVRYTQDELSPEGRHTVERHTMDCVSCSEALEGLELYALQSDGTTKGAIAALADQIDEQTTEQKRRGGYFYWSVAASITIFLAVGSWWWLQTDTKDPLLAEKKTIEVKKEEPSEQREAKKLDAEVPEVGDEAPEPLEAESDGLAKPMANVEPVPEVQSDPEPVADEILIAAIAEEESEEIDEDVDQSMATTVDEDPASVISPDSGVLVDANVATNALTFTSPANAGVELTQNTFDLDLADAQGESKEKEATADVEKDIVKDEKLEEVASEPATESRLEVAEAIHRENNIQRIQASESLLKQTVKSKRKVKFDATPFLNEGIRLYERKEYDNALSRFQVILKSEPGNKQAICYSGMCLQQLKRSDDAIVTLAPLTRKKSEYRELALWHTALAHQYKADKTNAIKILDALIKLQGEYAARAVELKKSLTP